MLAQCPAASSSIVQTGSCPGKITLSVHTNDTLLKIRWYKNNSNILVKTAAAIKNPNGEVVAGGNGTGNGDDQLNSPEGICLDKNGNLYIADQGNNRIEKYNPGYNAGSTIAGNRRGKRGDSAYLLSAPQDVFVDSSNNVFVADSYNNRIQKFTQNDTMGITVAGGNGQGSNLNQLTLPFSIVVDKNGNIYTNVFDRVLKFPPNSNSKTDGDLIINNYSGLLGMFVDNGNNLYIADQATGEVQKWPPNATAGITVAGGNGFGPNNNQINAASDVCLDKKGNVFVTDANKCEVQMWPPGAATSIIVACGNGCGNALDQLDQPYGICLDDKGFVYVSDSKNNRVLKFDLLPVIDTVYIPTSPGTYFAIVTDSAGCTYTTNSIVIDSDARVTITASADTVCTGGTLTFTATPYNVTGNYYYTWMRNDTLNYTGGAIYIDTLKDNGDVITSVLNYGEDCVSDTSNPIKPFVNMLPQVYIKTPILLAAGGSVQLQPQVTGNISSYIWKPVQGLSDIYIKNPVATLVTSTNYTLIVSSAGGCFDSATTSIQLLNDIYIPTAFTPNADGLNDNFYVLGGPVSAIVKDMMIYDRWGEKIFETHNALLNSVSSGWNGFIKGYPATPGAYIYLIDIKFLNGTDKLYKGTITLLR